MQEVVDHSGGTLSPTEHLQWEPVADARGVVVGAALRREHRLDLHDGTTLAIKHEVTTDLVIADYRYQLLGGEPRQTVCGLHLHTGHEIEDGGPTHLHVVVADLTVRVSYDEYDLDDAIDFLRGFDPSYVDLGRASTRRRPRSRRDR